METIVGHYTVRPVAHASRVDGGQVAAMTYQLLLTSTGELLRTYPERAQAEQDAARYTRMADAV